MGKLKTTFVLMACVSALPAAPALAHHSGAMFDDKKNVTIEGAVKEWQLTNPHSYLYVMVPDQATGVAKEWTVETAPSGILAHMGWRRNTIKPGDKVSVALRPAKDQRPFGLLVNISVNGEQLGKGGPY